MPREKRFKEKTGKVTHDVPARLIRLVDRRLLERESDETRAQVIAWGFEQWLKQEGVDLEGAIVSDLPPRPEKHHIRRQATQPKKVVNS